MSMDITSATVFIDKDTKLQGVIQKGALNMYLMHIQEEEFKSHYISFYFHSKEQIIILVDQLIKQLREVD